MTDLEVAEFVEARAAEDEIWAVEASRDGDNPVPVGGAHWQWVTGETDLVVTPDPATTDHVGDDDEGYGRDVSLRSVEEHPVRSMPGRTLPQFAIHTAEEVLPAVGGHIIRHDPARVLRDVEAARDRVRLLRVAWNAYRDTEGSREPFEAFARGDAAGRFTMALRMVALDAAVWREHPDYRAQWADPGWRPDSA